MYYLLLIAIALVLVIFCIYISYTPNDPIILSSDFLLTSDTTNLREQALVPFNNEEFDNILHKNNPIGMYNMSVRKTDTGYSGVIRGSSADGCRESNSQPLFSYAYYINLDHKADLINTQLIDLDYESMTLCPDMFLANGFEDSKLFIFKGEEWVVGNVLGSVHQPEPCANTMCIFKISDPRLTFKLLSWDKLNPKQTQKNWAVFEFNQELYCEYSLQPHVILKIDPETGITTEAHKTGKSGAHITSNKSLRAGACPILINYNGQSYYLNIGHVKSSYPFDYNHFFYIFEALPPFKILDMTDCYKLDYKARIQFAAGISEHNNNIYVSYGIEDCDNRISVYSMDRIMSMMRKQTGLQK